MDFRLYGEVKQARRSSRLVWQALERSPKCVTWNQKIGVRLYKKDKGKGFARLGRSRKHGLKNRQVPS